MENISPKANKKNPDFDIEKLINKDKRTAARFITYIESENLVAEDILSNIYKYTGKAYRIGLTGPPGAGKSTLTNQLCKYLLKKGFSVGIIAVDPTSPFSGGALLGDRVRMSEIGNMENVFIRSMATRGSLGGLSKKAVDAADILDAAGYDFILFETVGVGQSELDIAKAADTTVVVLVPESGDSVQAMKAGLMEIADLFVINKSDRPGAEQSVNAIKNMVMLRDHDENTWFPNIVKTVATENLGIDEVYTEIEKHKVFLIDKDFFRIRREKRSKNRIKKIVENKILTRLWHSENEQYLNASLEQVVINQLSPYQVANTLINNFLHGEFRTNK